jgi:hypothetical protein
MAAQRVGSRDHRHGGRRNVWMAGPIRVDMSALLPGVGQRPLGIGGSGGVSGVDAAGGGAGDVLALGQHVGEIGSIDLLTQQAGRAMNLRANAVDLVIALDKTRDRSAQQVINGLA